MPKRRLLIRPGAIGDFIVSLPTLEYLRADYTEVWCARANVPLAGFADCAHSIGATGLDRLGLLPDLDVRERLARFDEIHSWYGAANTDFREAVAAFPFRFYPALPVNSTLHATEFYCKQVGAPFTNPRLQLPEIPKQNFVILHPFASSEAKRWPLDSFRELELLLESRLPVSWCRGPEEKLPNAVYISNLLELAKWIATARLYVGNDSGISHLAAACGVPTVALFGPSNAAVWAPRGPQVRVIEAASLDALRPGAVFSVAQTLL